MRRTFILVTALALAWGGYWWSGASAMERGFRAWLDARAAEGWLAAYESVETGGFPSRFDTSFRGLAIGPPEAGWIWRAPLFQTLMLSYAPNRAVAAWPGPQTILTPSGRLDIASERLRASVRLGVAASLPLEEFRAEGRALALEAEAGWSARAEEANLAVAATPTAPHGQRVGLLLRELHPPEMLRALLDPRGAMPAAFERVHLDADLGFDMPWDRFALEARAPRLTELSLRGASLEWGDLALAASGDIVVGADGWPSGRLDVRIEDWRRLLGLLEATGVVGEALAPLTEAAMAVLAGLSPDADVIEAPLSFQRGYVSFGPIPLGPAPRLAPRLASPPSPPA